MYPLKFKPVFQKRIWGGHRLRSLLHKPVPPDLEREPLGESWEIADLPPGTVKADSKGAAPDGSISSIVANGPFAGKNLHTLLPDLGLGALRHFPLLVKFLDAQQDLSVQVHPDAAYCRTHPDAHLKCEAWYVLHAEPGARIYKGLKPGVTRAQFASALETGAVEPLLHAIRVRPGDCHYLQSGTVHALGAGILAAEVQTPSDTTFRVFDWNRLAPDGKPRALHVKEALDCIDLAPSAVAPIPQGDRAGTATRLVSGDHFTLDRVELAPARQQPTPPGLAIWIILEGQGVIAADGYPPTAFARGDTLLLPASMKNPALKTIAKCTWLEARVPAAAATMT
jgi:mannose-6-phosphate isomerase